MNILKKEIIGLHFDDDMIVIIISSFIPESARWLLAKKRYKDAYHILRRNASMNGHELSDTVMYDVEKSSSETTNAKPHIADLLRSRSMAVITLSCWFMW